MAATTTQGTGNGSAEGNQKNCPRVSLGVERLIGGRVIASGSVVLNGASPAIIAANAAGNNVVTVQDVVFDSTKTYVVTLSQVATNGLSAPTHVFASYGFAIASGVATFGVVGTNGSTDTVNWTITQTNNC